MNNPFARLAAREFLSCSSRAVLGASLALTCAAPAFAQDTTAADQNTTAQADATAQGDSAGQAIVVTGIRASLDKSAEIKRTSTMIVDSVSAEDIGKLPDVSIADSLARLPGVTAQRLEGRDQRLSIRGLGPDFGTTLLNGREQVTVGDNRGVEYDQYPSEFFQNVNVYKSANASLIAAGISGTVDLRMLRPLDYHKRVVTANARGQMNGTDKLNPDGTRYGYRLTGTYIDQFAGDTLGIALGVSATSAPTQYTRYNAWGFPTDSNGDLILGGAKPYVQSNLLDRIGAVGTIEYQPSEAWHSTLDVLYSHFSETQRLRGIEFPLVWGGVPYTVNSANDGFVESATFTDVHGVQRNDYNKRTADNYSIGWNNVFEVADGLHFTVDASWSHADRTDFLLETYSGTGYNKSGPGDTVTITRNSDGTFRIEPTLDYTDTGTFKITDPQGWGYNGTQPVVQAGFLNRPSFKDDLKSLRASLNGDIYGSVFSSWEVGANYSRRKKTSAYTSYFLCPKGGGTDCTVASGTPTSAPVPSEAVLNGTTQLNYLGVPGVLTIDPLYIYNNVLNAVYDNRPVSLVRDNTVTENVWTGYAMLNLNGMAGGKKLKGSIGLQVVHTKQSSNGSISNFSDGVVTVLPASDSVSYTDFLPSATMSVELLPLTYVKMGASQTMVRPRMDQERVNRELGIDPSNVGLGGGPQYSPFSFNGGNVNLRPYKSINIDLSLEKYFAGGGYIAIAGYYKALSDYVDSNASVAYDFSDYLYLAPQAVRDTIINSGGQIGLNKRPENSGSGYLQGVEATLSLPFSEITPALDGFGFFGSASYTDSSIKLGSNPTESITLPGLSDWVLNASAYYEKSGFQARVNYRRRSSFLGEVAGLSANPTFRTVRGEGIVDAQIGYEFQEGSSLAGLSIMLQGKNLTDQPFVTYQNDDERQVIDYQRYGREYYVSVGYKF
ncbi:TonB-dependent receptor [Stakelama marina]|uniref:TonB-dependent receptor n=1 Tax=Stakelama marina TaxID=2826939 RepID=A0A8T4IHG6_9SPHN|nr:TonB-dependent receptor [Stakelama marina]MBR0553951.1 TonB-dependent receptor [Stakelama marina]